jgi:hypothetical protein
MTAGLLLLRISAGLSIGAGGAAGSAQTPTPAAAVEYRVDAKTSRLTVETETVGLASMFGHDHKFDARDFAGKVTLVRHVPARRPPRDRRAGAASERLQDQGLQVREGDGQGA